MAKLGRDIVRQREREAARAAAREPPPPPNLTEPTTVFEDMASSILPSRNGAALWAYYLGLFSLFPGLGTILMVIAIVQGVKALRMVRLYPQVKGRVHAVVGIVAGIIGGLISTTCCVLSLNALLGG